MQAALHQHARAAEFDGLANFFIDGVEIEDVALFRRGALQRAIEGAEGAIFGAKVRVINVAVDDVGDRALGMKAAADGVGFHSDTDQVVGLEHLQGLGLGERHGCMSILTEDSGWGQIEPPCRRDVACYVLLAAHPWQAQRRRWQRRCKQSLYDVHFIRRYCTSDRTAPMTARPTSTPTAGL